MRSALVLVFALSSVSSCLAQVAPGLPPALPQVAPDDPISQVHALLASLREDPNQVANWVLLGTAAERVALERPGPNSGGWLVLSRRAFESALLLDPGNLHIRAAIARTQEELTQLSAPAPPPPPAQPIYPSAQPTGWRRFFEPDPAYLRRDAQMPMYRAGVRGGLDQSPAQPEVP
jgi:hypothetical protein